MIDLFKHFDQQLLIFINSLHATWLDPIMFQVTKIKIFIPLFLIWGFELFRWVKLKAFLVFAVCFVFLILLTDQTANLSKNNVARYRPTHNVEIGQNVHVVNEYRGGIYGFYSGHAANTFGIAMFLFLLFRKRKTWIKYSFFPFAILTSYSRIYLGVHYPFDIFIGMLTGLIYGYLIYRIYSAIIERYFKFNENQL